MFKGSPNMRMALYIVSIVVNAAAIVVRPIANEWGDALQYAGGALAAITGVVAFTNVEKESSSDRALRKIQTRETLTHEPLLNTRCEYLDDVGNQCILPYAHPETYGHSF